MGERPDELKPDQAALDELLRAFGLDADAGADAAATGGTDRPLDTGSDDADESIEIVIVEQEPLDEPGRPTIIRIDDYSGSVALEPAAEPPPAAPPPEGEPDVGESDGDGLDGAGADAGAVVEPVGVPTSGDPEPVSPAMITIADGELPDPVYVEGNLERGGNRSIVFIEDDDTGDTLAPEAERNVRRGIEPRLRERRAAVRRAVGRRRLRWILAITAVVIVGVGALAVLGSDLFAIQRDQVTVVGAVYADPAEVEAVVDDLVGTPALLVDTRSAERRLEAIPWVDTAKVTVDFPHAVTIDIREREAISIFRGPDQRFRVLDREGRVLDVRDLQPIAYARIEGPDPVDLDPGEFAPQGYAAASELARNLTATVRPQLDHIEVTADGSQLDLLLVDGTRVRFGQARDLFEKLVRLETVLTTNPDREPGVIDVSTSEVTL